MSERIDFRRVLFEAVDPETQLVDPKILRQNLSELQESLDYNGRNDSRLQLGSLRTALTHIEQFGDDSIFQVGFSREIVRTLLHNEVETVSQLRDIMDKPNGVNGLRRVADKKSAEIYKDYNEFVERRQGAVNL